MEQNKEKYLRIFDFSAMDINRLNGASLLGDAITFGLALLEFEQKNRTDQKEPFTASLDFDRELIQLFLNLQTEWTLHDYEEVESFFEYVQEVLQDVQDKIDTKEFYICEHCYSLADFKTVVTYCGNLFCKTCAKKFL